MAVKKTERIESVAKFEKTVEDIKNHDFRQIYILCGEEPYYSDVIIKLLIDNVLSEAEKDFNYSLVYGNETDAGQIVSLCRRYPLGAEKQLVVVKEAQHISQMQPLEFYFSSPAPDTILVLSYTSKSLDKRTTFYKKAKVTTELLESYLVDEEQIPMWIEKEVNSRGYKIEPNAANLLGQSIGSNLRKIVLDIDKLLKGISTKTITAKDVEENIGISRDYNPFEMCKAITERNSNRAFEIAEVFANNPKKYPIQATLGAMFFYFNQLLKWNSLLNVGNLRTFDIARQCAIFGDRIKEFEIASKNFPLGATIKVISYLKECDYKSKSNERGTADDGTLLKELLVKIVILSR